MNNIPSDNQIRNLLDHASPALLSGVFTDCFTVLKQSGVIDSYRVKLGKHTQDLLIALDGTEFFPQCNTLSALLNKGERWENPV